MPVYLINGASGTGKTAIGHELQKRGFRVIDSDEELSYFANLETEEPIEYPEGTPDESWYKVNGLIWDRKKIEKVLEEGKRETIFIAGAGINDHEYYPRLTKIFRLYTDPEILVQRLQNRAPDHPTNNPLFIRKMVDLVKASKPDAENCGWELIDTTSKTVEQSVDEIIAKTTMKKEAQNG